jgi:hypothetical protein
VRLRSADNLLNLLAVFFVLGGIVQYVANFQIFDYILLFAHIIPKKQVKHRFCIAANRAAAIDGAFVSPQINANACAVVIFSQPFNFADVSAAQAALNTGKIRHVYCLPITLIHVSGAFL